MVIEERGSWACVRSVRLITVQIDYGIHFHPLFQQYIMQLLNETQRWNDVYLIMLSAIYKFYRKVELL